MAFARPVHAQQSEPGIAAGRTHVLRSVRIEPALPGENPWERVGASPGSTVTDDDLQGCIERAVASGTFAEVRASIGPSGDGIELLLTGQRRQRIQSISLRGVDLRAAETVRSDLGLSVATWTTDAQRREAEQRLRVSYQAAGYHRASVHIEPRRTARGDDVSLEIVVSEGEATRMRHVRLVGPDIRRELAGQVCDALALRVVRAEEGLLECSPLIGRGDISDARGRRAIAEQVAAGLRSLRYFNARLEDPREAAVVGNARSEVDLEFAVRVGPRFEILVVGADHFPDHEVRDAMRIDDERIVDETTASVLASRIREFYARRAFLDARAEISLRALAADRVVLTVHVREGQPVYVRSVAFEGAHALSYRALRDILDEQLRTELPGGGLIVSPTPSESRVTDGLNTGSSGAPRLPMVLRPEQTFVGEVYQDAARRMTARYHEQGYLDAEVTLERVPVRGRDEVGRVVLDVVFHTQERALVSFDELRFEGNDAMSSATLARHAELRLGGPVSLSAVSGARDRIIEQYRELGYNFVRVVSAVDRSPDGAHARVRYTINEGSLVRVSRVEIRGLIDLPRQLAYVRLSLHEGDIFRPSLARESQRRLAELGYFSGVAIALADPDVESSAKTLIVQLNEASGAIEGRVGASLFEPLRGSVQYTRRNVLRSGIALSGSLQAGIVYPLAGLADAVFRRNLDSLQFYQRIRGRIAVSLQLPPLLLAGADVRPALDLSGTRSVERQFAITSGLLSASASLRPQRGLTITPVADLQINELELFGADSINTVLTDPTVPPSEQLRLGRLLLLPQGVTALTAGRVTVSVDGRDQVFNPQRGVFFSGMLELVGMLAFIERTSTAPTATPQTPPGSTLRTTLSFSGYVSPSFGVLGTWTFASNLRVGLNVTFDPCNRVTYPNRQFFLGGADTMRGWLQDAMIPSDVLAPPRDSGCSNLPAGMPPTAAVLLTQRGGDAFVLWRNELRVPLGGSGLALDLFVDMGNLWKELRNVFSAFAVRISPGIGVRYISPIGPVGIDLGINPTPYQFQSGTSTVTEPTVVLSFSIGSV